MMVWCGEKEECQCVVIHSLVNATTLQELNVEVRGIRHLSVHNLKKKERNE